MADKPAAISVGIIEPRDAVEAFQRRGLLQPSFRWQDVWQEEHSRAFAVAGVQRLDILQVFDDALGKRLQSATGMADFIKTVKPQLVAKGWWGDVEVTDPQTGETRISKFDDARLRLIYDVNVRQSFAAGQWARIERSKARMPFIIYKTMGDDMVRPQHRAWNNLVLPVDHPFWNTHFPPCGWRCRCRAFALDQAGIDQLVAAGQKLQFEAPPERLVNYVNPRSGEVAAVPYGIDPGFAYNPGKARDEELHQQTLRKAWAASPLAGAVAVAQATYARQEMLTASTKAFGDWVDDIAAKQAAGGFHTTGELRYVSAFKPAVVRQLGAAGITLDTPAVAVRDVDIVHTLRASKVADGVAVDISVYKRLPELLERASAVLLDQTKGPAALLYVIDLIQTDGAVAKLVVQLDQPVQTRAEGNRVRVPINIVRTATVMNPAALSDKKSYRVIWGRL